MTENSELTSNEETKSHNKSLGERGENAAVKYLEGRGYEILERNWLCHYGEADIIARQDNAIVFVEVKTRANIDKGFPEEAVTKAKRHRYELIAAHYLKQSEYVNVPVRFDVVALLVAGQDRAFLRHHINAFGVD